MAETNTSHQTDECVLTCYQGVAETNTSHQTDECVLTCYQGEAETNTSHQTDECVLTCYQGEAETNTSPHCIIGNFHGFLTAADFFCAFVFKTNILKRFLQKYYLIVKWFGSR